MKKLISTTLASLFCVACLNAQTFDMKVAQPSYNDSIGYGWDVTNVPTSKELKKGLKRPVFFSVKVPDGNYKVTVTIGSKKYAANTTVRAENRRLFIEPLSTKKGELKTFSFVVNKRSPYINNKMSVRIKEREKDYLNWDNRLTIEFNGTAPAVAAINVEKADVPTVFL